jgi:hypothetical protein
LWEEPTEAISQNQRDAVGILAACGGEDVKIVNSSGLERDRGGDLECVSLEGRSALEFMKILNTDADLLLR